MEAVFFLTLRQKIVMIKLYFPSKRLNLVESLMAEYFDYDPSMLLDEKRICLRNNEISDTTYNKAEKKTIIDFETPFKEHEELFFRVSVPYKEALHEYFSNYFQLQDTIEQEVITEDDKVLLCLEYMSYIYYKEKENLFSNTSVVYDLDLEYDIALQNKIYPEILSLYKMILESKNKRNRDSKVTITYKQTKLDINAHSWFLDDMEKYFADRFPNLTLDEINEILPQYKGKAGRKFGDYIVTVMIWGTYHLAKNHLSIFKNSNVKISNKICEFIISYLKYLGVDVSELKLYDPPAIRGILKEMMKRNFTPKWNLPWRNYFSIIEEKQPETLEERLNQPLRRYNIYT